MFRRSQAELAKLGGATTEELVGGASFEEQLAACEELTRFAGRFEDGAPSSTGTAAKEAGGSSGCNKVLLFLTDGSPNTSSESMYETRSEHLYWPVWPLVGLTDL